MNDTKETDILKSLDNILDKYVDGETAKDDKLRVPDEIRFGFKEDFKQKLIKAIITGESEKLAQETIQKERELQKRDIQLFVIEAVALAFVMGLLVNQITNLITFEETSAIVACILILFGVFGLILWFLVTSKLNKFFDEKRLEIHFSSKEGK